MADVLAEALVELEPDLRAFSKKLDSDVRKLNRAISDSVADTESRFKSLGNTGSTELNRLVSSSDTSRRQMLIGWRETAQGFEQVYRDAATGIERSVDVTFKSIIRQQQAQARSAEDELKKLNTLAERESREILRREEAQGREVSRIVQRFNRQRERDSARLAAQQQRQAQAVARGIERANKEAERQAARLTAHYENESRKSGAAIERNIGNALRRVGRTGARGAIDFSVNTAGLTKAVGEATKLGAILSTLGLGAIAGQAGIGGLAVVASGLSQLIGVAALLPAVGASAAVALGVLSLGVRGVGDALSETDPEKFAEALEKLAPSAQEFARAVRNAQPALDTFQRAIQQELFTGFAGEVDRLAGTLLPRFQQRMVDLAGEFNDAGFQVSRFITSVDTMNDVDRIIERTGHSTDILTAAIQPVLRGLRDIGAVGAEFLPQLAGDFARAGIRFGEFIKRARESGALQDFIQRGINSTKLLASTFGNLGRVVGGVFSASERAGGTFLEGLDAITERLANVTNSVQGQETLTTFFESAREVGADLIPLLGSVARIIGRDIAPLLASVGSNVLPAITRTIDAVGLALNTASPGIVEFSAGFADLLDSLTAAGVVDTLGQLVNVLGTELGGALRDVGPILGEVLNQLGDELVGILPQVIPRLAEFGQAFGELLQPAVDLLGIIGSVVSEVVLPALSKVAETLTPIIDKVVSKIETVLLPMLPDIREAFDDVVEAVGPLVDAIGDGLVESLELFVKVAPDVLASMEELAKGVEPLFAAIGPVVGVVNDLNDAFNNLVDSTPGMREAIGPSGLFGIITAGLNPITVGRNLVRSVVDTTGLIVENVKFTTDVTGRLLSTFGQGTEVTFSQLRDRAGEFLGGMRDHALNIVPIFTDVVLGQFGRMKDGSLNIFGQLLAGVTDLFGRTDEEIAGQMTSITDTISSAWNKVLGITTSIWGDMDQQISQGIVDAVAVTSTLPGQLQDSLGNIHAILEPSGQGLVNGLIAGIRSRIDAARSAATWLMESVGALFPSSPAKEGPFSGRGWTPFRGAALTEGFAVGMLRELPALRDAATRVTRTLSEQLPDASNFNSSVLDSLQAGTRTAQRITQLTSTGAVPNRIGAGAGRAAGEVAPPELPSLQVNVQIGERELTPMIVDVIDTTNGRVKRSVTSRARRTL